MLKRAAVVAALGIILAGCNFRPVPEPSMTTRDRDFMARAAPDVPLEPGYDRYEVDDPTGEKPGTIVVDTKSNFLYFIMPGGKAIRYGVATGSEAFGWTGTASVARKAEWPRWMPPSDMLQRWPHLRPTAAAGGLSGGPDNPLGARALYLYQGSRDTLYRIHGTNEPDKIGQSVSSGCIRMRNVDVIDLYNRTATGAKVIVR